MKVDDLIKGFQDSGLGEKEARAYVALARLGVSGAAQVAEAAGLKRPDAYRVLEELQARGLVEATIERPKRFSAVSGEKALAVLRGEREAALRALDAGKDALLAGLAKVGKPVEDAGDLRFRILQDERQLVGQAARAVEGARKEVLYAASSRGLRLLEEDEVRAALDRARARGVKVRVVVDVEAANRETAQALAKVADVRHAAVPRGLRFLVVDDGLLAFVTADPLPASGAKETALWFGASDLVNAERTHFGALWKEAVPLSERVDELATGRPPEGADIVRGRVYRLEKLKEMAFRAETSFDLAFDGELPAPLARVLADRAKEGLKVRLLLPPKTAAPKGCEARPWPSPPPAPFAVADGRELLLVLGTSSKGRAAKDATDAAERAVWSGLPAAARGFAEAFEAMWGA